MKTMNWLSRDDLGEGLAISVATNSREPVAGNNLSFR